MAIKISFDSSGTPEAPTFVLASRNGEKIGTIHADSVVLKDCLNDAAEISFGIRKYADGEKCLLWDHITDFKLVWCKEWDTWFEITVEIDESDNTTKTVYGTRLGAAELSQIVIYNTEINTENDIAREDYEIPTVLYNAEHPEASLLHRLTEKAPHYEIAHVDSSIANIQRTFSFDGVSVYDAFQEIAEEIGCLFVFPSDSDENGNIRRTISVYDLESTCPVCGYRGEFTGACPECGSTDVSEGYGRDTTIFVTSEELADNISFTSDTDGIKNCFRLEGGDDLMTATIRNCNPNGTDYIWYISDDIKKDMPEALAEKLDSYDELYAYYQTDYAADIDADAVAAYNAVAAKYQAYNENLKQIIAPVTGYPALMTAYYNTVDTAVYLQSGLMPDAEFDETDASAQAQRLTAEQLSPVAVSDVSNISLTTADSAVLAVARVIVDSGYQVKINSSELNSQTWTGSFTVINASDENDTAASQIVTILINDDYEAYVQQKISKALNQKETEDFSISGLFAKDYEAFCTELKKYCLDSLNGISGACQSCIDILIEQGIADSETWAGSDPNLYEALYLPYYRKLGAIQEETAVRQAEIDGILGTFDMDGNLTVPGVQTYITEIRRLIQDKLDFERYLGEELWLEFCTYRREDKYANSNYISDGLNNSELFEKAMELIGAASKELYKSAELQHSVSASLKNLLVIDKFRPLADYFEVGNHIRISCDDAVYKLRLLSYEIDFDNLENISVEFSDVIKTANGVSDTESILSQAASMASSYAATQKQASQGVRSNSVINGWLENGLDAANTKIVGGAGNQTQTWDSHGILLREYNPITDTYEDEQSKIINSTYAITDDNWKTVKTAIGKFYYYSPDTGKLTEAYGVNGEVLAGKLILGEKLGIYNSAGNLTFDERGFIVTNGTNSFTVDPNSANIVQIARSSDADNGEELVLYADQYGYLHVKGIIDIDSGSTIQITDDAGNISYQDIGEYVSVKAHEVSADVIIASMADIKAAVIEDADMKYAAIDTLTAATGRIDELEANTLTAEEADVKYAAIDTLTAATGRIDELETTALTAESAEITNLQAEIAGLDTLIFGSASGTEISTQFANAVVAMLGNAQIKDAMIADVSAGKISAGTINTNNVNIQSESGLLKISDNTIQISDGTRVRVQIGKDASEDYSVNIWDADGRLMFSQGGITENAIKGAIIRDDMVSDTANISAGKLDIGSLFEVINDDGSHTLKSAKIYLDEKEQTLDMAFQSMTTEVEGINQTVTSQGTQLDIVQGQITNKIWQSDITEAIEDTETQLAALSNQYSEMNQTVDGITATVASHTTAIETKADQSAVTEVSDAVTQLTLDVNGFKSEVSSTYATQTDFSDLKTRVTNISTKGLGMRANATSLTASNNGEIFFHGFDSETGAAANIDGYVTIGSTDYAVTKGYWVNPNTTIPYNSMVYLVYDTATNGILNVWTSNNRWYYQYGIDNPLGLTPVTKTALTWADTMYIIGYYKNSSVSEGAFSYYGLYESPLPYSSLTSVTDISDDLASNYSTTTQMNSAIEQKSNEITLSVDSKITTAKAYADTAAGQAEANAIADTAEKLKAYSTTEEMNSSIEIAKDSITSQVSASYTTKTEFQNSEPFILGTQTAVTGAWTGTAPFAALTDGQMISYWLPYAGSGNATLNLTLSDGTTTGAINCYYSGASRLTTHYAAGNVIRLTYRKNVSIAGSTTLYTGWWADANYNVNTYDRTLYNGSVKTSAAVTAGNIIVGNASGFHHLKAGTAFDIGYPILYAASGIASGSTGKNNYLVIPFNITTTQSITLTAYKSVYIKGTISGSDFTPVSTAPLTQTIPTTEDGYYYILLGTAYSTTAMYLLAEHPVFVYVDGAFQQATTISSSAYNKALENAENIESNTTEIYETITKQNTSITSTCQSIILDAVSNCVSNSDYGEFKETVETQLEILADEISMNFTGTNESISNVDEDLQEKFTKLYKYIKFSDEGIEIGTEDNGLTLTLDNEMIVFRKNGEQFGWWDGTDFHTGNIVVEVNERAQFGNFAFVPRSDGSLSFLKVGE